MGPGPTDSTAGSPGPPDRQTLQLLDRQLRTESLIAGTEFDPDVYEPRLLHALVDAGQYPETVVAARFDIRWFTTDDFSFHYVETHQDDSRWECRWDRHPNPHNARLHFHRPPNAVAATDLSLSSCHPLDVYSTVLDAIEGRIQSIWEQ
ncbi:hypothetical protein ACOZ4F_12810 [Haloarcula marismortui]|uniref:hypothetical protein n=1 Tax=Haloarcula marismortui TaxID=2238 RepID=UPI003C72345D